MKKLNTSLLFAILIGSFATIVPLTKPNFPMLSTPPTAPTSPINLPITLPTSPNIAENLNSIHPPTITPPTITGDLGSGYPAITTAAITTDAITLPTTPFSGSDTSVSLQLHSVSTDNIHAPTPEQTFETAVPALNLNINSFPTVNDNNIEDINTEPLNLLGATTPEALLSTDAPDSASNLIVDGPIVAGPVYTISGPVFTPAPEIIDIGSLATLTVNTLDV